MPNFPQQKKQQGNELPAENSLLTNVKTEPKVTGDLNLEKLQYLQNFIVNSMHIDCLILNGEGDMIAAPTTATWICHKKAVKDNELCALTKKQSLEKVRSMGAPCSGVCEFDVRFAYIPVFQNGQVVLFWQLLQDEGRYRINSGRFLLAMRAVTIISDMLSSFLDEKHESRSQLKKQTALTQELKEVLAYAVFEIEAMNDISGAESTNEAILSAIAKTGNYFDLSRITVFRSMPELGEPSFLFEWEAPGVRTVTDCFQGHDILLKFYSDYDDKFDQDGFYQCDDFEKLDGDIKALLTQDNTGELMQAVVKHDGKSIAVICFEKNAQLPKLGSSRLAGLKAAASVLTAAIMQKLAFDYAERSQQLMYTIADSNGSLTYAIDTQTKKILFMNRGMQSAYPGVFSGDSCSKLENLEEGQLCAYCPLDRFKAGDEKLRYEVYKSSFNAWYELLASRFSWFDGREACLISFNNINSKKVVELEVEKLAYYDAMLDIPNRACLMKVLHTVFDNNLPKVAKGVIIILDLDDFKYVNDTLGSQYGDELLKRIVQYFNESAELVGKVFRFGGDEFFMLLQGYTVVQAKALAKEILLRFNRAWSLFDVEYICTASLGIVGFPDSGSNPKQLIANSEFAVYDAKATGKNKYVVYDEALCKKIERKNKIQDIMRRALRDGKFEVYYQPIFNIKKKCFTKAEALLRLKDEELGFIPPDEFIGIAEEIGLISEIGLMVVDQVCKNLCDLAQKGIHLESMAINISPLQMVQENFVESMWNVISQYDIPSSIIEFEITENVLIRSFDSVKKIMTELQRHGINFALDDFGSGYSGLNYLLMLPISCLKIDKSYVNQLEGSVKSRKMLEMIIELVQDFNMQVVAEGVETAFQDNILKQYNCNFIQGFLYSRPLPKAEFERVVANSYLTV